MPRTSSAGLFTFFSSFSVYNMMNITGWGSGLLFFWGLHVFSVIVFGIGLAFLLFWASKYFSERTLWKWGWILVVVGSVLCLLTLSAWPTFGMMGNINGGFGRMGYGMMSGGNVQTADDGKQPKEEAEGKVLYDKLQAKEVACADLADSDFELIGEYLMGQRAAASHEQMNAMIKQMMGTQGEEQMHIIMGKQLSACVAGVASGNTMMGY